ncbi:glycine cleavage system aminomethyltransferase GcvT [Paenibacillus tarimensis]|uniref:glycine cleavage system aminomethyltransferase GcvT n=1 Tax=Paenibacillus tarimensis TaxID=416012 RepID=UPI001F031CB6|nr:glycine cleavage system aminomethyltransferase GcvT [Paenibacillus tarimensis]MCF2944404.1 glycine cleavage system aminomethyltransferase GcvT [Paenibacillus tarimensis]
MTILKHTPLFSLYAEHPGIRCIDFGGWELPVQFSGIGAEHAAVRERAALFDVSHMGEIWVTGRQAEAYVQQMTTNDVTRLTDGAAQYTLMCNAEGGTVDDLLVYRVSAERYMLVVNAANIDKDYEWLQQHLLPGAALDNRSEATALLALQGPLAGTVLSRLTDAPAVHGLAPFHFLPEAVISGCKVLLSRTGYTGENGFEIYANAADAPVIWRAIMQAGEPAGLVPAGLGARDTLRFEAGLPLYGQELSPAISPLEAGLGLFVKLDKDGGFIGREALVRQKEAGLKRKLVGIEMRERGIPRSHYQVYAMGRPIGEVTSGTQSPTLKRNLGLALLEIGYTAVGTEVEVDIRGKRLKAEVVKTPFYRRPLSGKGVK